MAFNCKCSKSCHLNSLLTWINSDMPWIKAGTPGSVTLMAGDPPETLPPTPAVPPKREPSRWGKFPSEPSFCVGAVLVVLEEVCVDVLVDTEGAVVEEEEEEEVEKENEWDKDPVEFWSPVEKMWLHFSWRTSVNAFHWLNQSNLDLCLNIKCGSCLNGNITPSVWPM